MPPLPRFVARSAPGSIRGYSAAVARLANGAEVRDCVSALTYNHLDPAGRPCNIRSRTTVRLDRQPNAGSGDNVASNFQLQVNAAAGVVGAGTTIGQVLVPLTTFLVAHHHPEQNLRRQLESVVRGALNRSATSNGVWFIVHVE
ncbi:MAG: hypothetical protein M9894_04835 [Planctomycetes bacterium]|nr:hypothetical protein [Planctomycetota bacterium]